MTNSIYDLEDIMWQSKNSGSVKIFISHRSLDKKIADIFVKFLALNEISHKEIFCSSLPGNDVDERIDSEIFKALRNSCVDIILLSNDYYESVYCTNEAGAIWYKKNDNNKSNIIVINVGGIKENEMRGFIDKNYILRSLDSEDSINKIVDLITEKCGMFKCGVAKLSNNVKMLIKEVSDLNANKQLHTKVYCNTEKLNDLEFKIKENIFTDIELIMLKFLHDKDICILHANSEDEYCGEEEMRDWLKDNSITKYNPENAFDLFIKEGIADKELQNGRIKSMSLKIVDFRNLRNISPQAITIMEKAIANFANKDKKSQKLEEQNVDFTNIEMLFLKYAIDNDRSSFYTGWREKEEIEKLQDWCEINGYNFEIIDKYSNILNKLKIRKLIVIKEITSCGNPKEYSGTSQFLSILDTFSKDKRAILVENAEKYKIEELPF